MTTRRREDELLLQCVRSYMAPESNCLESVVSQDIDWEKLIQKAVEHKVMPLLYQSLHRFCPKAVPKTILNQLQELFLSNARRSLFLTSELLKLVKLLERDGIAAIAFKGPVLSVYAYGNLSLRQYVDLDILVRRRDIFRAKDVLLSNGYRLSPEMAGEAEAVLLQSHHAFVFLPESPLYSVDLHWAIAQPHHANALNQEVLWERVESVSLGGNSILTFRPEEMMLFLCMHGSKHSWEQLGWICDVAQLVRSRPDLDWKQVVSDAEKAGCMKSLLLALELAKNLVGGNFPSNVLKMIDSYPKVKAIGRSVTKRLFADKRSLVIERFQQAFIVSRLKQRIRDRIMYLLYEWRETVTPNAKDQALVSLPLAFSFVYYILRPIRLALSYGLLNLLRPAKSQKTCTRGELNSHREST
jgi:hypothetical protein